MTTLLDSLITGIREIRDATGAVPFYSTLKFVNANVTWDDNLKQIIVAYPDDYLSATANADPDTIVKRGANAQCAFQSISIRDLIGDTLAMSIDGQGRTLTLFDSSETPTIVLNGDTGIVELAELAEWVTVPFIITEQTDMVASSDTALAPLGIRETSSATAAAHYRLELTLLENMVIDAVKVVVKGGSGHGSLPVGTDRTKFEILYQTGVTVLASSAVYDSTGLPDYEAEHALTVPTAFTVSDPGGVLFVRFAGETGANYQPGYTILTVMAYVRTTRYRRV